MRFNTLLVVSISTVSATTQRGLFPRPPHSPCGIDHITDPFERATAFTAAITKLDEMSNLEFDLSDEYMRCLHQRLYLPRLTFGILEYAVRTLGHIDEVPDHLLAKLFQASSVPLESIALWYYEHMYLFRESTVNFQIIGELVRPSNDWIEREKERLSDPRSYPFPQFMPLVVNLHGYDLSPTPVVLSSQLPTSCVSYLLDEILAAPGRVFTSPVVRMALVCNSLSGKRTSLVEIRAFLDLFSIMETEFDQETSSAKLWLESGVVGNTQSTSEYVFESNGRYYPSYSGLTRMVDRIQIANNNTI
jgi:hypothetical protein